MLLQILVALKVVFYVSSSWWAKFVTCIWRPWWVQGRLSRDKWLRTRSSLLGPHSTCLEWESGEEKEKNKLIIMYYTHLENTINSKAASLENILIELKHWFQITEINDISWWEKIIINKCLNISNINFILN